MRDARAESKPSPRIVPPTSFVTLAGTAGQFACPFSPVGINLYALAFAAAQRSARDADRLARQRRTDAQSN